MIFFFHFFFVVAIFSIVQVIIKNLLMDKYRIRKILRKLVNAGLLKKFSFLVGRTREYR